MRLIVHLLVLALILIPNTSILMGEESGIKKVKTRPRAQKKEGSTLVGHNLTWLVTTDQGKMELYINRYGEIKRKR